MIPLICIDIDGTLVGRSGDVRPKVLGAIDRATSRGQHIALTTARGAFGASWTMAQRVDPTGWHVFHAGGAVVHASSRQVRDHPFADSEIASATAIASDRGWVIEFYSATDYTVESEDDLAISHAGLLGVPHRSRTLDELDLSIGGVVRIQYVVPTSLADEVMHATNWLGLTVTSATSPIMPGSSFVSLTRPGISKATGISMISHDLGIPMADVMMVGDGANDLPALVAVGHAVAMGNAESDVLDAAEHIVADVENDGVVEALNLSIELVP